MSREAPSLTLAALVFYTVMSAVGLALILGHDVPLTVVIFGDGAHTLRDTLLGGGTGLAVVLLTRLVHDVGPMARLTQELRSLLGQPSSAAIAVLAVSSAVGEELLFRGGIQPLIGFWPTALVFGLLHGGGIQRLRVWAIFAFAAGVLLGWLAEFTGNLLAPILCHLTVNFWNLHLVANTPERT